MGWSFEHKEFIKPGDVKRTVDSMVQYDVIKSVMVANTYYAAVKVNNDIVGLVVKTSIRNSEYCNFGTKFIPETMGPSDRECPESVLKLLTPVTGSEDTDVWAREWREKCHEFNRRKKKLKNLPINSIISCNGNTYKKSLYRKKTKWINWENYRYLSESQIARYGFEV